MIVERRKLGWGEPDIGLATIIVAPGEDKIRELVSVKRGEAVHLIGGTRGCALGQLAFDSCRKVGALIGLASEAADPRGVKGMARRLLYTSDRYRMCRSVDFILGMGTNGVRWYRTCGWPSEKVFPYAYITETPERMEPERTDLAEEDLFSILYVGQLIPRKGVDLLLRALRRLKDREWILNIVGDGALRPEYEQMVATMEMSRHVFFSGTLPNDQVFNLMSNSDLLVLPSRFDGWGAVVNESLMCGVPVICSDCCGASDLLMESWRGEVYPSSDPDLLMGALRRQLDRGRKTPELSRRIRSWAECIQGPRVAGYLINVLDHVYRGGEHPDPPWYEKNKVCDMPRQHPMGISI